MTKKELLEWFNDHHTPANFAGDVEAILQIQHLIKSSGSKMMTRTEFDELVDFIWHALDRRDVGLLARRLRYIFKIYSFIIVE